jgi:hypothetical protein
LGGEEGKEWKGREGRRRKAGKQADMKVEGGLSG